MYSPVLRLTSASIDVLHVERGRDVGICFFSQLFVLSILFRSIDPRVVRICHPRCRSLSPFVLRCLLCLSYSLHVLSRLALEQPSIRIHGEREGSLALLLFFSCGGAFLPFFLDLSFSFFFLDLSFFFFQGIYAWMLESRRLKMTLSLTDSNHLFFTLEKLGFFKRLFLNLY